MITCNSFRKIQAMLRCHLIRDNGGFEVGQLSRASVLTIIALKLFFSDTIHFPAKLEHMKIGKLRHP